MIITRIFTLITVIGTISAIACGGGTSSGKVLVNVNGEKITEGDIEFLGQVDPRIKIEISNPAGKKRILDNLVEQNLLYQEAVKEGVARDPKVKAMVDLSRRFMVAKSLVDNEIEKQSKKYYDEHQDEFKKLELSHIMIGYLSPEELKKMKSGKTKTAMPLHSEDDALKLITSIKSRLDKGENFATVAKEVSEDAATKSQGGSLGKSAKTEQRLEARGFGPLLQKAFEMKVGEVAGPIKTPKGYHLITITSGVELEPFEITKERIAMKLRGTVRDDLMARLKKESKINYPEEEKAKKEAEKKETGEKSAESEKKESAPTPVPQKAPEAAGK